MESPDPRELGAHWDHEPEMRKRLEIKGSTFRFMGSLPVAAPEIFRHEGQWYIASLMPTLKGIRIARLKWVETADANTPSHAPTPARWKRTRQGQGNSQLLS